MTSRLLSWSAEFGYFGSSDSDDDDGDDSAVATATSTTSRFASTAPQLNVSAKHHGIFNIYNYNNDDDNVSNSSFNASIASNAQQQQRCSRAGTRAAAHVGCGECAKQRQVGRDFVHGEHDVVAFVVGHDGVLL
jgi:hypothetical protein